TMPSEYFKWLGINAPPEQGEYVQRYRDYLKDHVKVEGAFELEEFETRSLRSGHWPWHAKDEPELADWLKRCEKPLALVIEASRRPEYYNPLVPRRPLGGAGALLNSLLPNVQRCRELAFALTCRAMLRVGEGQTDAGWQDLLACHRLAR